MRIDYYPPRGDAKEGWDNIDIFGWLGMPMQIKVNFLCRDSILAAPIVLDLALFLDLAKRAGLTGIQEWLSFYFKSPQCRPDLYARARPLHPAPQAQEHAAHLDGGGGASTTPGSTTTSRSAAPPRAASPRTRSWSRRRPRDSRKPAAPEPAQRKPAQRGPAQRRPAGRKPRAEPARAEPVRAKERRSR